MSIISWILAEANNELKASWVKELKEALEKKDWNEMERVITKIDNYYFSE